MGVAVAAYGQYTARMKGLFNLLLLLALCVGGLYAYIHLAEDYELLASIQNMQDQLLVEWEMFTQEF